jgi:hypothetical protein
VPVSTSNTMVRGKKHINPIFQYSFTDERFVMGVHLEGDDKKSLKKMFPNLMRELEGGENKVAIDSLRADPDEAEAEEPLQEEETAEDTLPEKEVIPQKTLPKAKAPDKFRHYNPSVVDFIRRCDTQAQAEEIVAYLQKRGELACKDADQIRAQLKKEGVRSFGPKKENDYYFKQSGIC